MKIKVKKCREGVTIPQYATDGSACFDLCAWLYSDEHVTEFVPGEAIATGLQFEIPEGHVMMVYSRSGHGFNHNVRLANCCGIIDSDFRGELKVKLTMDCNYGDGFTIRHGDRIAQAMVIPVQQVQFEEVDELTETVRGTGGFGSTGK